MSKKNAADLLSRYAQGDVSEEEKALVESWYLDYVQKAIDSEISDHEIETNRQELLNHIMAEIEPKHKINYFRYVGIVAAVLIIIFTVALLVEKNARLTPNKGLFVVNKKENSIPPGGNNARLILSNGNSINLAITKNGILANEKGVVIHKNTDGQITYSQGKDKVLPTNAVNQVITPRGGQYKLVLSDGTRVWLNSASSLKYPVVFTGMKREIELLGEAYFEVSHNRHKPFRVLSKGQMVEVLGTHFNVNAYQDEQITKTTLLEGSVKVLANGMNLKIKPGEQVQLKSGGLTASRADMEEAIAWKNGFFYFKDDDIKTVMRQLSRWYNVEIKYEGQIQERKFSGQIERNMDASQLLHILSIEKIHYRIEGKAIVITP